MDEIRDLAEYPNYSISINGEVYNEKHDRPVKVSNAGTSKASVQLWVDGRPKMRSLGKLHREAFPELY